MTSARAPSVTEPARASFSPHSSAKTNDKSNSSGRMVSSGINDVVIASVHSEKTHLKKLMIIMTMMTMIIIIIMNKLQETTVSGCQKLTSALKLRPRKVMIDFKFDALYRLVFIESLQKLG